VAQSRPTSSHASAQVPDNEELKRKLILKISQKIFRI
jgi:hypothetical protein